MEAQVTTDAPSTPIQGYSRADVDQFLTAAAEERLRLETEVEELEGRISRARSAIGMHRVMVALLLETQRELTEIRDSASAEAERIVREAEREVATMRCAPTADSIDLVAESPASRLPVAPVADGGVAEQGAAQGDEYMDFLRGALSDDSPLGPVGE
jgi:cell division septum initiation protein DivIVA